ncbi:MAG: class I SAM-dependent methyltransferase [Azoarcus sp.]
MVRLLKRLVRRLCDPFSPSLIGIATNPFWLSRRAIYRSIERLGPALRGRVVDFGCGTVPYRKLLTSCDEYVGLDFDSPRARSLGIADVYYDGISIPMENGSIDGLLSTQSLEHVPNPEHIVGEWARVLKTDGLVLATVPLMWPEHEVPWDFHRFTTHGLRTLMERQGFEVLSVHSLLPDCRAPAQLFLAWFYDAWLARCGGLARLVLTVLICPPVVTLASLLAMVSPSNPNTYLDNAVLARRRADKNGK